MVKDIDWFFGLRKALPIIYELGTAMNKIRFLPLPISFTEPLTFIATKKLMNLITFLLKKI